MNRRRSLNLQTFLLASKEIAPLIATSKGKTVGVRMANSHSRDLKSLFQEAMTFPRHKGLPNG